MSRNSPEAIAERLLDLSREIAPAAGLISDLKETLRKIVEESGDSFLIEVPGKGSVEVKAGAEERFKGIVPTLVPEVFLELPESRRNKLVDDGVVVMEKQHTKASRPAVTVRL